MSVARDAPLSSLSVANRVVPRIRPDRRWRWRRRWLRISTKARVGDEKISFIRTTNCGLLAGKVHIESHLERGALVLLTLLDAELVKKLVDG